MDVAHYSAIIINGFLCLLSPFPVVQLYWGLNYCTLLTQRREDEGSFNLYHCADEGQDLFGLVAAESLVILLQSRKAPGVMP